jgi:hypothetical protein
LQGGISSGNNLSSEFAQPVQESKTNRESRNNMQAQARTAFESGRVKKIAEQDSSKLKEFSIAQHTAKQQGR